MDDKLRGVIIPVATPFVRDELSLDMLIYNIQRWNPTHIRGYMALGSNGESRSLSDDEACSVIETIAAHKSEDKLLMAGVTKESLPLSLEFIDRMAQCGADYASVLTPHYFAKAMDDEALKNYYLKLADRSVLPIFIYCAPSFANGVVLSAKVLTEVASHPNIVGIKDTSSNMMQAYCDAASGRDDFTIYAGSIKNIMIGLLGGAAGGVVSAANYLPEECAKVTDLFFAPGGEQDAIAWHAQILDLAERSAAPYGIRGLKACMNILGYQAGDPRTPVLPLGEGEIAQLRELLQPKG